MEYAFPGDLADQVIARWHTFAPRAEAAGPPLPSPAAAAAPARDGVLREPRARRGPRSAVRAVLHAGRRGVARPIRRGRADRAVSTAASRHHRHDPVARAGRESGQRRDPRALAARSPGRRRVRDCGHPARGRAARARAERALVSFAAGAVRARHRGARSGRAPHLSGQRQARGVSLRAAARSDRVFRARVPADERHPRARRGGAAARDHDARGRVAGGVVGFSLDRAPQHDPLHRQRRARARTRRDGAARGAGLGGHAARPAQVRRGRERARAGAAVRAVPHRRSRADRASAPAGARARNGRRRGAGGAPDRGVRGRLGSGRCRGSRLALDGGRWRRRAELGPPGAGIRGGNRARCRRAGPGLRSAGRRGSRAHAAAGRQRELRDAAPIGPALRGGGRPHGRVRRLAGRRRQLFLEAGRPGLPETQREHGQSVGSDERSGDG